MANFRQVYNPLTGLLDNFIGQGGAIRLTASIAVQNEPFEVAGP